MWASLVEASSQDKEPALRLVDLESVTKSTKPSLPSDVKFRSLEYARNARVRLPTAVSLTPPRFHTTPHVGSPSTPPPPARSPSVFPHGAMAPRTPVAAPHSITANSPSYLATASTAVGSSSSSGARDHGGSTSAAGEDEGNAVVFTQQPDVVPSSLPIGENYNKGAEGECAGAGGQPFRSSSQGVGTTGTPGLGVLGLHTPRTPRVVGMRSPSAATPRPGNSAAVVAAAAAACASSVAAAAAAAATPPGTAALSSEVLRVMAAESPHVLASFFAHAAAAAVSVSTAATAEAPDQVPLPTLAADCGRQAVAEGSGVSASGDATASTRCLAPICPSDGAVSTEDAYASVPSTQPPPGDGGGGSDSDGAVIVVDDEEGNGARIGSCDDGAPTAVTVGLDDERDSAAPGNSGASSPRAGSSRSSFAATGTSSAANRRSSTSSDNCSSGGGLSNLSTTLPAVCTPPPASASSLTGPTVNTPGGALQHPLRSTPRGPTSFVRTAPRTPVAPLLTPPPPPPVSAVTRAAVLSPAAPPSSLRDIRTANSAALPNVLAATAPSSSGATDAGPGVSPSSVASPAASPAAAPEAQSPPAAMPLPPLPTPPPPPPSLPAQPTTPRMAAVPLSASTPGDGTGAGVSLGSERSPGRALLLGPVGAALLLATDDTADDAGATASAAAAATEGVDDDGAFTADVVPVFGAAATSPASSPPNVAPGVAAAATSAMASAASSDHIGEVPAAAPNGDSVPPVRSPQQQLASTPAAPTGSANGASDTNANANSTANANANTNASTSTCDGDDGGDDERANAAVLQHWFLCNLAPAGSAGVVVGIEGDRVASSASAGAALEHWRTSAVVARLTRRVVLTRTGTRYYLEGPMDLARLRDARPLAASPGLPFPSYLQPPPLPPRSRMMCPHPHARVSCPHFPPSSLSCRLLPHRGRAPLCERFPLRLGVPHPACAPVAPCPAHRTHARCLTRVRCGRVGAHRASHLPAAAAATSFIPAKRRWWHSIRK